MPLGQAILAQRFEHVARQLQQPQLVCDSRLRFADAPRGLLLTHAEHADELAYAQRLLDEVQVAPLQILDQRDEARVLHVHVDEDARDFLQPRKLRRAQAALPRHELIFAAAQTYGERV